MKRMLCLILSLTMILPLAGCAQPEAAADETVTATAAPTETTDPTEAVLTRAQALIGEKNLEEAEALLEPLDSADPRVSQLLAQIEEAKQPIDLKITLSYDGPNGRFPPNVKIHSVTAQAIYPGTVRYTVDYTAPRGTPINISGSGLSDTAPQQASGQRETLVFEIPEAHVRAMGGIFRVEFKFAVLLIGTQWPGEGYENLRGETVEIPLHMSGELKGGKFEIHALTVQPLNSDQLIYTLDYTPSKNGLCFSLWLSDGTPLKQNAYTDHSRTQCMMVVDRAAAVANEKLCLSVASSPYREPTLFGEAVLSEYHLPEYTFSEAELATQPEKEMSYQVGGDIYGDLGIQIHSVTSQTLDNGYVRIRVDYSALPDLEVGSYAFVPAIKGFLDWTTSGGREQRDIYLPLEDYERIDSLKVAFSYYDWELDRYTGYYIIHVSTQDSSLPLAAVTFPGYDPVIDEAALTQPPVELDWRPAQEDPGDLDMELYSCTIQPLENGWMRLRLEYKTPAPAWIWLSGLTPSYKFFDFWNATGNREHRDIYLTQEDFEHTSLIEAKFRLEDSTKSDSFLNIEIPLDE